MEIPLEHIYSLHSLIRLVESLVLIVPISLTYPSRILSLFVWWLPLAVGTLSFSSSFLPEWMVFASGGPLGSVSSVFLPYGGRDLQYSVPSSVLVVVIDFVW